MNNLKKLLLAGLLAVSLSGGVLAAAHTVYCPGTTNPPFGDTSRANPEQSPYTYTDEAVTIDANASHCPARTAGDFVTTLQRIFSGGAAVIAAISGLFILYAAFLYIMSHGDEEKVAKAKDTIVYAIMGLVVAGLAYGIPFLIRSLLF